MKSLYLWLFIFLCCLKGDVQNHNAVASDEPLLARTSSNAVVGSPSSARTYLSYEAAQRSTDSSASAGLSDEFKDNGSQPVSLGKSAQDAATIAGHLAAFHKSERTKRAVVKYYKTKENLQRYLGVSDLGALDLGQLLADKTYDAMQGNAPLSEYMRTAQAATARLEKSEDLNKKLAGKCEQFEKQIAQLREGASLASRTKEDPPCLSCVIS